MLNEKNNAWQQLLQAGLVTGDAPQSNELESPWYVNVILALSGWFAAFFFLGFLSFMLVAIKGPIIYFILGSVAIVISYVLLNQNKRNVFVEHVALALSLAGQLLVGWALFDIFKELDNPIVWLLLAAFLTTLSILMPSFLHGVMSSLFAGLSFAIGLSFAHVPYLAASILTALLVWIWLFEFHETSLFKRNNVKRKNAMGYGLVLAVVIVKGFDLFGLDFRKAWADPETKLLLQPWVGELLLGFVSLYLVWKLLQRLGYALHSTTAMSALFGTLVLTVVSMEASGITVGMAVLLLGFANSNKILMGLGISTLIFYISSYYYLLELTLMEKSQIMLGVGLVLLVIRWVMKRMTQDGGVLHD